MTRVDPAQPTPWRIPVAGLLTTADQTPALRARAASFIERLAAKPQVAGIGILGGLAQHGIRPFADEFSDIDISVLLTCPLPADSDGLTYDAAVETARRLLPGWLPNFKFRDPVTGTEFNLHQQIAECESRPDVVWANDKCSAYADTLDIVYDPDGCFATLVAAKTAGRDQRGFDAAVALLSRGRNLACEGVDACLGRGRLDAAREIIARVSGEALEVMLFLSGIWPPGIKWQLLAVQALLDQQLWLPRWDYPRILALRQPASSDSSGIPECRALQAELLALLQTVEARAAATFPDWPGDVYAFAMTRLFTDKQQLATTAADTLRQAGDYAARLTDPEWNLLNHALHQPASLTHCSPLTEPCS